MSNGQIVVTGLTKVYGRVRAVDDLSFTVSAGRVTGFLGPNGAGKTTTLRMILNLVTPTSGTATIGGRRYVDIRQPLREVGAILEASSAHRGRTGRDHLRIICASAGFPLRRADEVLELTGLDAASERKFRGYSLGMRQRLGIAAALLGDPQVLILDEPANGLDPEGIRWMRDLLRGLAKGGRTILVSSHLLAEVEQLVDDVIIIANGRLAGHGPVAEVVQGRAVAERVRVRTPHPEKLLAELGLTIQGEPGDVLLLDGLTAPHVGAAALRAGVELHELVSERPDLEHAFLELTAGKAEIR